MNPKTIDLVLRKGMKFHDGKPVTGEDVRFTFDYLKKWEFPFFRNAMAVIDKVEVNGMNFRFPLKEPLCSVHLHGAYVALRPAEAHLGEDPRERSV